MNDLQRKDYLTWITSQIGAEYSYHNHKETMSWVITALFVPSILVFSRETASNIASFGFPFFTGVLAGILIKLIIFVSVILVIIAFTILAMAFVSKQFQLREETAVRNAALLRILGELCRNDAQFLNTLSDDDLKIDESGSGAAKWPKFIKKEFNKITGRTKSIKVSTDYVCYAAIILACLIALILQVGALISFV